MQTRAIVSQTNGGGRTASIRGKVFRTKMFSRSYEFRSAAVLEGSKTIGRQVNRTIGINGRGEAGSTLGRGGAECDRRRVAQHTRGAALQ